MKFIKIISSFIIIGFAIIILVGFNVESFGKNAKAEKADCIIVLGCSVYGDTPSPFLSWRIEEGERLIKEGYADYIIASGGKGSGENISEGEAIKRELSENGIDEEKIIVEDESESTMENLINSKKIMDEKGFKTAIIVSNKFHLKRASLMAEKINLNASYSGVYVTPYKNHERIGFLREIPAVIRFYILGY
nr:YdcF family protein [Clostridium sp. BJN0001]